MCFFCRHTHSLSQTLRSTCTLFVWLIFDHFLHIIWGTYIFLLLPLHIFSTLSEDPGRKTNFHLSLSQGRGGSILRNTFPKTNSSPLNELLVSGRVCGFSPTIQTIPFHREAHPPSPRLLVRLQSLRWGQPKRLGHRTAQKKTARLGRTSDSSWPLWEANFYFILKWKWVCPKFLIDSIKFPTELSIYI